MYFKQTKLTSFQRQLNLCKLNLSLTCLSLSNSLKVLTRFICLLFLFSIQMDSAVSLRETIEEATITNSFSVVASFSASE